MSLDVKIKKRLGNFVLNVEFSSEQGVTGLLGASGCGKTLVLKCIAGIAAPDSGRIVLNGITLFDSEKHINLPPQRRKSGYLFQNYALFPNMTVERNIACGLHQEKNKTVRNKAVAEMITRMHLEGLEKLRPHQLSGGQQQRAALARILVGQPEILLLDEPFSALDSHLKDQLMPELRTILKAFGKDTLLVTHDRDEAYRLCQTLAIMECGQVTGIGGTQRMFADPGTRSGAVLTGCKNIIGARKAGHTLVEIPAWGITLDAGRQVDDTLCAVGIRAHYFSAGQAENAFPVRIVDEIEEPFEWTIKFRYDGQDEDSESVWWRVAKGDKPGETPRTIGVARKDILLFYA